MTMFESDKTTNSPAGRPIKVHIYTIGHSNKTLNDFLEALTVRGVNCVVDVRSIPYSSYNKEFSRKNLQYELPRRGFKYVWLGESLGGIRPELENSAGFRNDEAFNSNASYRQGLVQLLRLALTHTVVVMCSEEDPRNCHRHKLIADSLLHRRTPETRQIIECQIDHIRANGNVEDAAKVKVTTQMVMPI